MTTAMVLSDGRDRQGVRFDVVNSPPARQICQPADTVCNANATIRVWVKTTKRPRPEPGAFLAVCGPPQGRTVRSALAE